MEIRFKKVAIVGPGLIGGSLGLALKKRKLAGCIIGVARHCSTLENANKKQAIDIGTTDVKQAVKEADLVILATPVRAIKKIIEEIKNILNPECIVFDVGSTKREIVDYAQKMLPKDIYFIGAHPMAGSEKAGVVFARESLFQDSVCFLTKTKKTNKNALCIVESLWKKLGARTIILSAARHDRLVARVSHLPHLVSVALVDCVQKDFLRFAATGFKDATRIASGDPALWRDISFSNRDEVLRSIRQFEEKLNDIKKALQNNQESVFMRQLSRAKIKRDAINHF